MVKDVAFYKKLYRERGEEEELRCSRYKDWKHINTACSKHGSNRAVWIVVEKYNNYREYNMSSMRKKRERSAG